MTNDTKQQATRVALPLSRLADSEQSYSRRMAIGYRCAKHQFVRIDGRHVRHRVYPVSNSTFVGSGTCLIHRDALMSQAKRAHLSTSIQAGPSLDVCQQIWDSATRDCTEPMVARLILREVNDLGTHLPHRDLVVMFNRACHDHYIAIDHMPYRMACRDLKNAASWTGHLTAPYSRPLVARDHHGSPLALIMGFTITDADHRAIAAAL